MAINKLAAVYNVWDGVELLHGSMELLVGHVDIFIVVWQKVSNYGEHYNPWDEVDISDFKPIMVEYNPTIGRGNYNEKCKRNIGITQARMYGCSHFIQVDCDEYYYDFAKGKKLFAEADAEASVCKMYTYFKEKHLRFENPDNYYVPFINRLHANTQCAAPGFSFMEPFYVDPTRRVNTNNIIEIPIFMHHYSYVRKDIERKINNSSAKHNIIKSKLLADYNSPDLSAGYYVADFRQKLIAV